MEPGLLKKWESAASRHDELTTQLMDSVRHQPAGLARQVDKGAHGTGRGRAAFSRRYRDILKQLEEAAHLLSDPAAGAELHSLATEETAQLEAEREALERRVLDHLTPKDPRDDKNLFLEIRAGTGGDEAALFAGDLSGCISNSRSDTS